MSTPLFKMCLQDVRPFLFRLLIVVLHSFGFFHRIASSYMCVCVCIFFTSFLFILFIFIFVFVFLFYFMGVDAVACLSFSLFTLGADLLL